MRTHIHFRLLLACALLPFLIATPVNIYFVQDGWHGKIPGYIAIWAGPVAPVLDSGLGSWVWNSLDRHVGRGSLIPGIAVFIWLPALIYSAILASIAVMIVAIRAKLRKKVVAETLPVEPARRV